MGYCFVVYFPNFLGWIVLREAGVEGENERSVEENERSVEGSKVWGEGEDGRSVEGSKVWGEGEDGRSVLVWSTVCHQ